MEITARLTGADGRPDRRFTLDQLLDDGFDDRSYFGELTRDDVAAMCGRVPRVAMPDGTVVDVSRACPVIRDWDLHMNVGSRYSPILEGSSFVMATEFTGRGPRTRTILTYSESSNPASPFASDQTGCSRPRRGFPNGSRPRRS